MSVHVFLVCVALASQLSTPNDRYPYQDRTTVSPGPAPTDGSATAGNSSRRSGTEAGQSEDPYAVPSTGRGGSPSYSSSAEPRAQAGSPAAPPFGYPSQPESRETLTGDDATDGLKPSEMMRAMLAVPRGSHLTGQTMTLADVLQGAASRQDQSERVDAYWDLCSSVADYYLGLREQEELRRLRGLVRRVGPTWEQAESELSVRIGTSQRAAVASQHRVASFFGENDPNRLPLPADVPHCGDYSTRYDEIFAGRWSVEAEKLRDLLPLRYAELKDAAMAVTRAEEWADRVATQRSDNSDGTGMLRSLELLALRRRAFVQIARDYNRRIARYAELAAPGQVDPQQLVAMLIKVDERTDTANRNLVPVSPNSRHSGSTTTQPRETFVQQWTPSNRGTSGTQQKADGVVPASAEETPRVQQEQSLLVTPDSQ